jgi:NAD(P)-dependent dehydrogenase (short-subunit alcohol dehydrogenase family)
MQLAGKVALVTGAQQGIGRAIAIQCAAAGTDIAINWLDDEAAAREVAAAVTARGRRAVTIQADMAKLDDVCAKWSPRSSPNSARSTSWSTMPGFFHASIFWR